MGRRLLSDVIIKSIMSEVKTNINVKKKSLETRTNNVKICK